MTTPELHGDLGHARGRLREAAELSDRTRVVPAATRLRPLKQALVDGLRPITGPQAAFNEALIDTVTAIYQAVDALATQRAETEQLAAALADLTRTVEQFGLIAQHDDTVAPHRAGDTQGPENAEKLIESIHDLKADLSRFLGADTVLTDDRLTRIEARLAVLQARQNLLVRASGAGQDDATVETGLDPKASTDRFYEEFEDRFRGEKAFVEEMLRIYLPDIEAIDSDAPVLDIGCGRGEWLGMLAAAGIEAYGLDTNDVAIARCRAKGLDARNLDMIDHLTGMPEGSLRAITSFHVVEHLPFDLTVELVDAAMAALAPGGLLILETPNPTNLTVGGSFFWIDPTHLRPMHPELLQFLVENRGFIDVQVRYLHPRDDLRLEPSQILDATTEVSDERNRSEGALNKLNDWIFGHLDYAVVAHKPGEGAPA